MRSYVLDEQFGLEHLRQSTFASEPLGDRDVRVRLRAASLNYRDLMMVKGQYNPRQPLPLVPCSDAAGDVIEVGDRVTRFQVGDRVCSQFAQGWIAGRPTNERRSHTLGGPLNGVLREEAVFDQDGWSRMPEHLSYEEASTLPCAALTAWSALVEQGELQAGCTVLTEGTGGVSVFALQFAKVLGCRVVSTTSSAVKRQRLRELGADHTIDYTTDERWGRTARQWAGGDGVDHVVEVGGVQTLAQAIDATRPGGIVSVIGVLTGAQHPVNIAPILMKNIRLQGVFVGHRDAFESMVRAMEVHQMRPHIDRVFEFDQAPDAFAYQESGAHFGKVVVRI